MLLYRIFLHLSLLSFSLCLSISSVAWAADETKRYASCTEKVRTDPQAALAYANEWEKSSSNASSAHCKALALYAMKGYGEAAKILERISEPLKRTNLTLWQDITQQAARSWFYAKQPHRAIATLNRAVNHTSARAYADETYREATMIFLNDRADYYRKQRNPLNALQDYDHALSLDVNAHEIRIKRSTLLREMGEVRLSQDDATYVIQATPANNVHHQAAKKLAK